MLRSSSRRPCVAGAQRRYANCTGHTWVVSMEWFGGRRSTNIEDRRGMGVGTMAVGGGLGTVVLLLLSMLFGFDPRNIGNSGDSTQSAPLAEADSGANDERKDFVAAVVGFTE